VQYEEDIIRNAFSVKAWLRYLDHKRTARPLTRFLIYERALKELPGRFSIIFFVLTAAQLHFVVSLFGREMQSCRW
jgi:hypothetical protein